MTDLKVSTIDGSEAALSATAVDDFSVGLGGILIRPSDGGYDQARKVWNAMIDRHPALIVRCAGVADVIACVKFATEHRTLTSVRGGGHNVAGKAVCDGGLVIDLSDMRSVRVDPFAKTARVEAGAQLGDLDRETAPFGLVVPTGIVTETGVAGLTLGGGLGWLSRAWGLTCDNLISADVVTADGTLLHAGENSNPDLFWALRGGGGNFGIVTSFEFKCHKFGPIALAGLVIYPFDQAAEVLQFYRDYTASAPDEVTTLAIIRLAPPAPFLPPEVHGKPVVIIGACYSGTPEEGAEHIRPIKEFGNPLGDVLLPKPFLKHQAMLDAGQPAGGYYYWKSHYFDELTDDALDVIQNRGSLIESPMSILAVVHLGGAVSRVGEHETAYPNRQSPHVMNVNGSWANRSETDSTIGWVRDTWDALIPHSTGRLYVNFEADDGVEAIYGAEKYRRLAEIKTKYDPDNFFRLNQNIKPG